jgi:hypothetical protein
MMVNAVDVGHDGLIDELSRVFSQPGEALHLAQRAGFPVADVPEFVTATVFWERLVRAAEDGKLLGGVGAIVAQAKLRFPHNPIFAAHGSKTVLAPHGSKTVLAPMQPGLRLVHAVDPPSTAAVPDPNHGAPWPHGAANHQPPAVVPARPAAPPSDATSMNTNQSPFAPHPPHAYPPPTPQPIGAVGHTGRDARGHIKIDASTKTDNRKGLGAAGVTSIVLVVGAALCTMGWLAFDAIKSLPRNIDGSVTVWGVFTLPPGVVGEPSPPEKREDEGTKAVSAPTTPPVAPTAAPAVATRKEIEGVWQCDTRYESYTITFTEAGRAAFSHPGLFRKTPFGKWTDQPYTIVSAKTIEVDGMLAEVEVSPDGQALRAVGGTKVFNCKKVVI